MTPKIKENLVAVPQSVTADPLRRTLALRGSFGPDGITGQGVSDALEQFGPGRILILLDSPGGISADVDEVLGLLLRWGFPIRIRVDREASSGAAMLVASFQTAAHIDARFLIHRAWRVIGTEIDDPEILREALADADEQTVDILFNKMTGLSRLEIGRIVSMGKPMTARQALNLGLIDRIYGKSKFPPRMAGVAHAFHW